MQIRLDHCGQQLSKSRNLALTRLQVTGIKLDYFHQLPLLTTYFALVLNRSDAYIINRSHLLGVIVRHESCEDGGVCQK